MGEVGIRTLVVEDDPVTRRLLEEILRSRGHRVDACADGETGWASYGRKPSDLVLLDLNLPGMDGIELCRKIRGVPESEETVILFITGVEDRTAMERALDAGADDYLRKPVNDHQLHVRLAIAERRIQDTRERKEVEDHLRRDALHDRVTGLANRTFLDQRIEHSVRRGARESSYRFALLYLDVCDFQSVNARLGRDAGDVLLRAVGGRLEDAVRSIDTVARISADNFAIHLDGLTDVSDPSRVAIRIHQGLSAPFRMDGESVHLHACIGIALNTGAHAGGAELLRDAHKALENAKAEGPGSYRIFDPVMHAKAMARVNLESRIKTALEEGRMDLKYQPMVRLDSERLAGFEALLRWEDPERGSVVAADFVPVAEGSGLIVPLSSWVLDRGIAQLQEWGPLFNGDQPLFLSMNVSGRQFAQPNLATEIGRRLEEGNVRPGSFHIEITETSLMEKVDAAARILGELRERSVRVQVDDFGTGYSSLSYLCRFPVDTLKIDGSFVRQMQQSPENLEVVRTIVQLAHTLNMTVVAEGVETEDQLRSLRELGCDMGQGYLFSRPVTADEVPGLISEWSPT